MMPNQSPLTKNPSFFADLLHYIAHNRKWWLVPIAVVLLMMGGLVILGGTSAAPFIYTLF